MRFREVFKDHHNLEERIADLNNFHDRIDLFILSVLLLPEKLNIKKFFAIFLAVIAVLIMNIAGREVDGGSSILGIVSMLLAVASMALFFIYAKKFAADL